VSGERTKLTVICGERDRADAGFVCSVDVPGLRTLLGLAAERALARRKELSETDPLHARPGHELGVAREERSVLDLRERFSGALGSSPVGRVRLLEQLEIARGGLLAPTR